MRKAPTVNATLAIVREMGLTATYSAIYREFTVNFRKHDARWSKDSDFKTDSRLEAIYVARQMTQQPMPHPLYAEVTR